MNKETQYFLKNLESTLSGKPWFGRPVYAILEEVEEKKVVIKPGGSDHSMLVLIWHMITWAEFVLGSLENKSSEEMKSIEANDWRDIDPKLHTWTKGMERLKEIHIRIMDLLKQKNTDDFLNDIVTNRQYNFRFLLNGLIQHNIYHLGQIAYIQKMLIA